MAEWIRSKISVYLTKKNIASNDEIYSHLILLVAYSFAAFMHVFLLVVMLLAKEPVLIAANVLSLLTYFLLGFPAVFKRRYLRAGLLISLEVLIYFALMIWRLGSNNYTLFYLLLVVVMQIIIPYGNAKMRGALIVFLLFCSFFFPYIDENYIPPYDVGAYDAVLSYFNLVAGMLGIILELLIGNAIRNLIASIDTRKLEVFENQAHTDQLTGLYNRRYAELVFERLKKERNRSGDTWCIAMLDIDDFKKVNDTYGHSAGDEVLVFLASFLQRNLRRNDVVFRWGGEEFLLLLEDVENQMCGGVLEKVRSRLSRMRIYTSAGILTITVTIGVAALDADDVAGSIELSDERLYEGKQTGKNKVVTGMI